VSLTGILISTVLGVAAQLKEASDDATKALNLARKTDATLEKEDITLLQLNRLLAPSIEDAEITMNFLIPCGKDANLAIRANQISDFCKNVYDNLCASVSKSKNVSLFPS
jgi:hypothetical protein